MCYVACVPINELNAIDPFRIQYAELKEGSYWDVIQQGIADKKLSSAPGRYLCIDYGPQAELQWAGNQMPFGVLYTVKDDGTVERGHGQTEGSVPRLTTWPPKPAK